MEPLLTRELLGKLGQHAWRPALLGWGIGSAIVALAWVLVVRFAMGLTTLQDVAALGAVLIPACQYIHLRGPASPDAPPMARGPGAEAGCT